MKKRGEKENRPARFPLPDTVRGVCILGMAVYHTLFDIAMLTGASPVPERVLTALRDLGASLFIFLSGFCFHFCRRRLRRFLVLFLAGCAVTCVTALVMPENRILFGILTFMAVSGALLRALHPLIVKLQPALGLIFSLGLFLLLFSVNYGSLGLPGRPLLYLPASLYRNMFTAFFGFPFPGFTSGDYYPLLPWSFICLAGYFSFLLLKKRDPALRFLSLRVPVLPAVGRYSLAVYLAHQPLILGAVWLIVRFSAR